MGQRTLYDPGRNGEATPFYQTFLEPENWWKWFKPDEPLDDDGWMQVIKVYHKYNRHGTIIMACKEQHMYNNHKCTGTLASSPGPFLAFQNCTLHLGTRLPV